MVLWPSGKWTFSWGGRPSIFQNNNCSSWWIASMMMEMVKLVWKNSFQHAVVWIRKWSLRLQFHRSEIMPRSPKTRKYKSPIPDLRHQDWTTRDILLIRSKEIKVINPTKPTTRFLNKLQFHIQITDNNPPMPNWQHRTPAKPIWTNLKDCSPRNNYKSSNTSSKKWTPIKMECWRRKSFDSFWKI